MSFNSSVCSPGGGADTSDLSLSGYHQTPIPNVQQRKKGPIGFHAGTKHSELNSNANSNSNSNSNSKHSDRSNKGKENVGAYANKATKPRPQGKQGKHAKQGKQAKQASFSPASAKEYIALSSKSVCKSVLATIQTYSLEVAQAVDCVYVHHQSLSKTNETLNAENERLKRKMKELQIENRKLRAQVIQLRDARKNDNDEIHTYSILMESASKEASRSHSFWLSSAESSKSSTRSFCSATDSHRALYKAQPQQQDQLDGNNVLPAQFLGGFNLDKAAGGGFNWDYDEEPAPALECERVTDHDHESQHQHQPQTEPEPESEAETASTEAVVERKPNEVAVASGTPSDLSSLVTFLGLEALDTPSTINEGSESSSSRQSSTRLLAQVTMSRCRDFMGITELARKLETVKNEITMSQRSHDKQYKSLENIVRKFDDKGSQSQLKPAEANKPWMVGQSVNSSFYNYSTTNGNETNSNSQLEQSIVSIQSLAETTSSRPSSANSYTGDLDRRIAGILSSIEHKLNAHKSSINKSLSKMNKNHQNIEQRTEQTIIVQRQLSNRVLQALRQHLDSRFTNLLTAIAELNQCIMNQPRTSQIASASSNKSNDDELKSIPGSPVSPNSFLCSLQEVSQILPKPEAVTQGDADFSNVLDAKCGRLTEMMISEFVVVLVEQLQVSSETIFNDMFVLVGKMMNRLLRIQAQWIKNACFSLAGMSDSDENMAIPEVQDLLLKYKKQTHRVVLKMVQNTLNNVIRALVQDKQSRTKLKAKMSKLTNTLQQQHLSVSKTQNSKLARQISKSLQSRQHVPAPMVMFAVLILGILIGYYFVFNFNPFRTSQQTGNHPF